VFHLCRLFRRRTGLTIHAYRHHLRLRNALEPLEQADADLLALALDLGYSGHSHFTALFRRQFGIVPSRLRDRLAMTAPDHRQAPMMPPMRVNATAQ
jgi:AraC-like DNA-binding protein